MESLWRSRIKGTELAVIADNCCEPGLSPPIRLLVIARFIANYPIGSPLSGLPTIRSELTTGFAPDQVHACKMMTEVHTVSIVAKNK